MLIPWDGTKSLVRVAPGRLLPHHLEHVCEVMWPLRFSMMLLVTLLVSGRTSATTGTVDVDCP